MKHTKIVPFFKALMVEIDDEEEDVIDSVVKFATRNFDREEMMEIMSDISMHLKIDGVKDLVDTIKNNDDFSGML
jgi:uncharacterized protein (DUF3820 family)